MKKIIYVPKICQAEGSAWQGSVTLKKPNFDERYEFLQEIETAVNGNGDFETDNVLSNVKRGRKMVSMSEKFYLNVDLKSPEGEEIKSFEDMSYCEELHNTLIEVAGFLYSGGKLGNV